MLFQVFVVGSCCLLLPVVICCLLLFAVVICCCLLLSAVVCCGLSLSIVVCSCLVLAGVVRCCLLLSAVVTTQPTQVKTASSLQWQSIGKVQASGPVSMPMNECQCAACPSTVLRGRCPHE